MVVAYRISTMDVSLVVRSKLSVGASNVVASMLSKNITIDRILAQHTSKPLKRLLEMLFEVFQQKQELLSRIRPKNISLPINFDLDYRGNDVTYTIYGSSIKGVLRNAFDNYFLNIAIERMKSIEEDDVRKFAEELKRTSSAITVRDTILSAIPENVRKYIEENNLEGTIVFHYLIIQTPFSCLSTILQCSYPIDTKVLIARSIANDILEKKLRNTDLNRLICIDVDNRRHCLPVSKLCVSCAIFGAPGHESLIKVSNFYMKSDTRQVKDFVEPRLRVLSGKGNPSPYTIQFLYGDNIRFNGRITIAVPRDPVKLRFVTRMSYIPEFIEWLVDKCKDMGLDECTKLRSRIEKDSISIDKLAECIERVAKIVVCFALWRLNRGEVGVGRRTSLGYGRVEVECDECKELWSKFDSRGGS